MAHHEGDWVLNDDGQWETRIDWLTRKGVAYAGMRQDYKAPTYKYTPSKPQIWVPYEGFDRRRFPNTFKTLMLLYMLPGWWQEGKQITGGYRNFLDTEAESEE